MLVLMGGFHNDFDEDLGAKHLPMSLPHEPWRAMDLDCNLADILGIDDPQIGAELCGFVVPLMGISMAVPTIPTHFPLRNDWQLHAIGSSKSLSHSPSLSSSVVVSNH